MAYWIYMFFLQANLRQKFAHLNFPYSLFAF
jgi:hypothetical protein